MTHYPISTLSRFRDELKRLKGKYEKKAAKERKKINEAFIVFDGEKYHTEEELFELYTCDVVTSREHDKLLAKLRAAQGLKYKDEKTESELLVALIDKYITDLSVEIFEETKNGE